MLEVPVGDMQAVLVASGQAYTRLRTLLSGFDLKLHGKPLPFTHTINEGPPYY